MRNRPREALLLCEGYGARRVLEALADLGTTED